MELRVGNKYRLGRKIGSGSFGDIYLGKCLSTFACVKFLAVLMVDVTCIATAARRV